MVEGMKSNINQVVSVMRNSFEQAQACVGHASVSQDSLHRMNDAISNIRCLNTQIEDAAQQQLQAVNEVSTQLNNINTSASETSKGAEEASSSSDLLLEISQKQQSILQRFVL